MYMFSDCVLLMKINNDRLVGLNIEFYYNLEIKTMNETAA